ncbi:MAG: hypothetical protein KJO98_08905 [Rhodothermia bacterium]|nr:hypothetical protein [Rhodothermia bacterium]
MARKSKYDSVLGVFVTDTVVDAVLMTRSGERIHISNRFARPRSRMGDRISDLSAVLPGLKDRSETDFTLEIGDGTNGSDPSSLFLSSEFGASGGVGTATEAAEKATTARQTSPITTQLKDVLAECANMGHTTPHISFCMGSTDVSYVQITPPKQEESSINIPFLNKSDAKDATENDTASKLRVSGFKRRHLLNHLMAQNPGIFDKKRVAFIPMTPKNGRDRYLAILPRTPDSVTPAIAELNSSKSNLSAIADIVDTEPTVYLSLARRHAKPGVHRNVAVIRVGSDDTMVMFIRDGQLAELEKIRSLTSYDPVETVCSRVLLKQDECKFGDFDQVLVVSDDHRDSAERTYQEYFPKAAVTWLEDVLTEHHVKLPSEGEVNLRSTSTAAIGVGLRWMNDWDKTDEHETVNLIPKRLLRKKKPSGKIAWHTYAILVAIFGIAFFYSWKFMTQAQEISRMQTELETNPPEFPEEDPALLKMRVDSLNAAYASYTQALHILDSLLVGSDRWTRGLARMTESTGDIGRIWLRSWTPVAGNMISLQGNALSRSRVARLAQEWQGSIEQLNFADIQKIRVYTFSMKVPLPAEIPPVALRLREMALEQDRDVPLAATQ